MQNFLQGKSNKAYLLSRAGVSNSTWLESTMLRKKSYLDSKLKEKGSAGRSFLNNPLIYINNTFSIKGN